MKNFYTDKLYNIIKSSIINLPTPVNLSIFWNFGSLLGIFLLVQFVSGLILTMHYAPNIDYSFYSVIHIMQDVNWGWLVRLVHMNGASMFFFCVYLHIGRGMYYGSYKLKLVWFIGVLILFLMMGVAFMGYVLPWGQMSFWGATVITNLLSALPYIGQMLVEWLWGGFSVGNSTLNRFYTFHFLLPFILMMMILFHLFYLHQYGSSNPLGVTSKNFMIKFHIYYTYKDMVGFVLLFYLLMVLVLEFPYLLGDSENFLMANSMVTPMHIQPEWYFLFAYSILRSIPNKLGGVMALLMSILILFFMPFIDISKFKGVSMYFFNQILFWFFLVNFLILTWLGSCPVEYPFIIYGQISTILYFLYFYNGLIKLFWDKLIN
nr:cytochrome b [Meteorus sp. 1 XHS-2023a]